MAAGITAVAGEAKGQECRCCCPVDVILTERAGGTIYGGDGSISTAAWPWWYGYVIMCKLSRLENGKISKKAGDFAAKTAEVPLAQEKELCPIIYPHRLAYISTIPISRETS